MSHREDRLVEWLRRRLGAEDLLGDDTAVLPPPPPGSRPVVTVDSQIAGVHHPADLDPALVARRLLAVNLSDLAATGAEPGHALLALSAPPSYDHRRFFAGLLAACRGHGVTLAGGDLARSEPPVASLTLLGVLPAGREPLRRGTARPGHALWLGGGPLGESAAGRQLLTRGARAEVQDRHDAGGGSGGGGDGAEGARGGLRGEVDGERASGAEGAGSGGTGGGSESRAGEGSAGAEPGAMGWDARFELRVEPPAALPTELAAAARAAVVRHLAPTPLLALGRALAGAVGSGHGTAGHPGARGAAMDVSDGLGVDLSRLCRASGVGAEVEADRLPLADGFAALCAWLGAEPVELAVGGGEDYDLLFTLPDGEAPPPGFRCRRIGRIVEGDAAALVDGVERRPLGEEGWDHLR